MNCLFCEIAKGNIKSSTIYEDDLVKCFLDIHPDSNGHLLIIPKTHFLDLSDIDQETLSHILKIAKKMKNLLTEKLLPDGIVLIQNNGALQEIKHFHLHLKPYYKKNLILPIQEIESKLK